eukprot:106841_1
MSSFQSLARIRSVVAGYLRLTVNKDDDYYIPPLIVLICQHYFKTIFDSVIMDRNEQLTLIEILMKNIQTKPKERKIKIDCTLLYRMSKHGKKPSAFHSYCDRKERIITVIQSEHGNVCGGFMSVAPSSNYAIDKCYKKDDQSFIFLIRCGFDNQCNVWKAQSSLTAVYDYCKFGPVWGYDHQTKRCALGVFPALKSGLHSSNNETFGYFGGNALIGGPQHEFSNELFTSKIKNYEVFQISFRK